MTSEVALRVTCRLVASWFCAFAAWFAATAVYGVVAWRLFHGRAVIWHWGTDKSLANLVLELPALLVLATIAFAFTRPAEASSWWRRGLGIAVLVAVVLVIVVPGFGE